MHTLFVRSGFSRLLAHRSLVYVGAALLWCGASPIQAAPSCLLNDTGQTLCDNGSNVMATCTNATTGDTATYKRQDGRFGRDPAAPAKVGGGAAGFDFTKICWNGDRQGAGTCTGALVANTTGIASASPSTDWACTKDNVTNLIWSLQSQNANWNTATGGAYPDAGHNTPGRCGFSSGWRVPTRRELLSTVHRGLASGPVVDAAYLPATQSDQYWTNHTVDTPSYAATVNFFDGSAHGDAKTVPFYVRLVRSEDPALTAPPGSGFANLANMSRADKAGGIPIDPVDAGGVTDPLGGVVVYSATGLPAGLSINSATGSITGIYDANGSEAFTVSVTAALPGGCIRWVKTFVLTITDQG